MATLGIYLTNPFGKSDLPKGKWLCFFTDQALEIDLLYWTIIRANSLEAKDIEQRILRAKERASKRK